MDKRSFSLPEESTHVNDIDIHLDGSANESKREGVVERSRTSPNSRRRVLSDVMPIQRQGSRDHSSYHMCDLPELREEEVQGGDVGVRDGSEHETRSPHLHPPSSHGRRSRRSSAPTLLEPIQEGLFGAGRRNSTPTVMPLPNRREASLSPARCGDSPPPRSPRLCSKVAHPSVGVTPEEDLAVRLQRRRRSEPDHHLKGLQANILYTTEGFFPQPRRNSLATATLNDIAARFELLDTRKKVVEEGADGRNAALPGAGSRSGFRCEGGAHAPPPISVTEVHY
ncbi:uncharacterized protein LOC121407413 [Lytechinus variegatus]|uniref:uncharacterized protein LOC121407413 n=1 Tax=Lytechinus variegatus TaxID=7654 RepID=UPI001BB11D99|nr:uncharacterized protein LOC121407413 [Lytechinus variegatus]XP_041454411.1 uncharacterized protein LOC121407413 [Lytechinus variegatus]